MDYERWNTHLFENVTAVTPQMNRFPIARGRLAVGRRPLQFVEMGYKLRIGVRPKKRGCKDLPKGGRISSPTLADQCHERLIFFRVIARPRRGTAAIRAV